jgi:type IV pilus assembly protein PilX
VSTTRLGSVHHGQRGIVLISSLLLLLVVTILALAMFRSMGLSEKIAGNVREKQRALHAAMVAQQYAEWWLSTPGFSSQAPSLCSASASANVSVSSVLICNNALNNPAALPWTAVGAGAAQVGFTYYPNATGATSTNMNIATATNGSMANSYYAPPAFYIQYVGPAADGGGNVYRIDAMGYGGNALSVAVVESLYEIGSGVTNLGGL